MAQFLTSTGLRIHDLAFMALFLLPAIFLPTALRAAAEPDPLFQSGDILDISLTGPFTTIDRERDKDTEYTGGTLTYMENGSSVTLEAKYEVRGNFRLREDICNYAQLWVDLDKDDVAGTLFENQNKLKLVVQCRDGERYERYVAKEDQVYRLYNVLTDLSYRSRLVNVTFIDTDRGRERISLGAFIEHKDRVAARNGLDNVDLNAIPLEQLDREQGNMVDIFMFMVANTDYSIISAPEDECCHNAKLFHPEGGSRYYPAPYDFDSSGYVDASYAQPAPQLKLRSVRQRLYRGFCVPQDVLDATLGIYRNNRDAMMAIAGDTTHISEREAQSSVKYLEDFYEIIDDPRKLEREILRDCRG